MPTILELCGENLPGGLDGVSLKQTLLKGDLVKHPPMYWETHEEGFRQAIRFERWKAIRFGMGEGPPPCQSEWLSSAQTVWPDENPLREFPNTWGDVSQGHP